MVKYNYINLSRGNLVVKNAKIYKKKIGECILVYSKIVSKNVLVQ